MATKAKDLRELAPLTHLSDTRDTLAHAKQYVEMKKFDDFLVVDIDAHVSEGMFWDEITDRLESDVWKYNARSFKERGFGMGLSNAQPGILYQGVNGRIPHQERLGEAVTEQKPHKQVTLARRAMDSMGIDYMSVFPTPMLTMGVHPQPEVETQLGQAYNRWLTEKVLPEDSGLLGMGYLPFNEPEACPKMIEEFGDKKGIIGFSVTSTRYRAVHHNSYMRLYAMMEERGLPLIFHAGFNWNDGSMAQLNRFLSMHALSFVHCNLVHMTNWVINGLPERFPKLKVVWIEFGPRLDPVPHAAARFRVHDAHVGGAAPQAQALGIYEGILLFVAAARASASQARRGHVRGDQRRDPASLRVGLAALGFRHAVDHLRPALP